MMSEWEELDQMVEKVTPWVCGLAIALLVFLVAVIVE